MPESSGAPESVGAGAASSVATAPVVARWEWRTFARKLPPSVRSLSAIGPATTTAEIYLLSAIAPDNVKIRHDTIDVKRLEDVAANGLELWRPVLKAVLPIDPKTLAAVCQALGLPRVAGSESRDLGRLIRDLTATGSVRAVEVQKRRVRIEHLGCPGERVELGTERGGWESLSFEHADPERVLAPLRDLGLEPSDNLNYPRGLKQIVAWPPAGTSSQPESSL